MIYGNACSHFFHRSSKVSEIGASHRILASHMSRYINFPSNNTGETRPNGSYTFAKHARTPHFVNTAGMVGNSTRKRSLTLSHGKPNNLLSEHVEFPSSCCLAKVGSLSTLSDSSSKTFECHLCNLNLASSKISIASRFNSLASNVVGAPEIRSSTYRLFRTSATLSG